MKVATWNIKAGRFEGYDHEARNPQRMEKLREGVRKIGAEVIALVDTFGWNDRFSNEKLQYQFGYGYAINVPLEDNRMRKDGSDRQVGVALLSNLPVLSAEPIRLYSRNAVHALVAPPDEDPVDVYGVYLDDLSENMRLAQFSDLLEITGTPERSVIAGDFNSLTRGEKFTKQTLTSVLGRIAVRAPRLLPAELVAIQDMRRGEVLARAKEAGFIDAAKEPHATAPTRMHKLWAVAPHLRIDYILHSPDLVANDFQVLDDRFFHSASDHLPIQARVSSKEV